MEGSVSGPVRNIVFSTGLSETGTSEVQRTGPLRQA
jgi:hypothetical protein